MQHVKAFAGRLRKAVPEIPIEYVDERFTSVMAHQAMIDGGLRKKRRRDKALADVISATLILKKKKKNKRLTR
jgi:putative Holliday junction resolvase